MENKTYKDMTAIEFLRASTRMCRGRVCYNCKAYDTVKLRCKCDINKISSDEEIEEAIEIIYEWNQKHLLKTRLSEYLKMFPDTNLDQYGFPEVCILFYDNKVPKKPCGYSCEDCKKEFWLKEIE